MTKGGTISQISKKIKKFLLPAKNQKGMALIMVLSTIVFTILLVQETIFETQIEYRSAVAELNSLRAYHAAKSGMEVNLLRVRTYKKLAAQFTRLPAEMQFIRSYLDLIWRFPFQWPLLIPDGLDTINTEEWLTIQDNSFMQAGFITSIQPAVSRIDINDLASPIPSLRNWTFQVLYRLIYNLRLRDEKLADEINEQDITGILQNIKDWVDPDSQLGEQNFISENTLYGEGLPPNRSFINPEELHQVNGMTDILYQAIAPFITVHGEKGLNINTAPAELLQALHKEWPIELAQEIAELTSNPINAFFFTEQVFSNFLIERGFSELKQYLLPEAENSSPALQQNEETISYLYFDAPHNFQLTSTGISRDSQKTIQATYFNIPSFIRRFKKLMEEEKKRERKKIARQIGEDQVQLSGGGDTEKTEENNNRRNNDKRETIIIYWKESS